MIRVGRRGSVACKLWPGDSGVIVNILVWRSCPTAAMALVEDPGNLVVPAGDRLLALSVWLQAQDTRDLLCYWPEDELSLHHEGVRDCQPFRLNHFVSV